MSFLTVAIFTTALLLQNAHGSGTRHSRILLANSFADHGNFFKHDVLLIAEYGPCSGSIIGDHHILTAAHCVVKPNSSEFIDVSRAEMIIKAGITNLDDPTEHHIFRLVEKIYIPKGFFRHESALKMTRDIAVLKLNYKLGLGLIPKISALKIKGPGDNVHARQSYVVTGFGYTGIGIEFMPNRGVFDYVPKDSPAQLRYAEVSVLHPDICSMYLPIIPEEQLCGKIVRIEGIQAGVCSVDSGAALMDIHSRTIIGVVSFGKTSCDDIDFPTVYTKVEHYTRFIQDAMDDKLDSNTMNFKSFENNTRYNEILDKNYKLFHEVRLPEWDYVSEQ